MGEVLQLRNQLALAQAQNETIQMLSRVIPEDEHLYILGEKDRRIEALVRKHPDWQEVLIILSSSAMILIVIVLKELQLLRMEQMQQHLSLNGPTHTTRNPMQEELISKLEEENKVLVEEVEKLKRDQEELLELLAEMESRIPAVEDGVNCSGGGDEKA